MDAVREQLWLVKTLVFPILEQIWLDKIDLSPSLTTSSLFKINLPHLSNVIFQTLSNEHGIIHDSASHIPLKNETLQTPSQIFSLVVNEEIVFAVFHFFQGYLGCVVVCDSIFNN